LCIFHYPDLKIKRIRRIKVLEDQFIQTYLGRMRLSLDLAVGIKGFFGYVDTCSNNWRRSLELDREEPVEVLGLDN